MKRLSIAAATILAGALAVAFMPGAATGSSTSSSTTKLSCNDGTNLNMALDTSALSALTGAVSAIDSYPAGSPALSCTTSTNQQSIHALHEEFAVGGGQAPISMAAALSYPCLGASMSGDNFAVSGHAKVSDDSVPNAASGTFNLSCPTASTTSNLVAKVDCLSVTGMTALMTALVTKATGIYAGSGPEITIRVDDSGLNANAPNGDMIAANFGAARGSCDFLRLKPPATVMHGNVYVKQT